MLFDIHKIESFLKLQVSFVCVVHKNKGEISERPATFKVESYYVMNDSPNNGLKLSWVLDETSVPQVLFIYCI